MKITMEIVSGNNSEEHHQINIEKRFFFFFFSILEKTFGEICVDRDPPTTMHGNVLTIS